MAVVGLTVGLAAAHPGQPAEAAPGVVAGQNKGEPIRAACADALQGKQLALYDQFKAALERHHTAGLKNGGGVDGMQLPPKVSADQLQAFIEKLASFLAKQQGIDEMQPASGQADKDFRTQLKAQSAADVEAHRQLYLDSAMKMIKNPAICSMVEEAIRKAPAEWRTAPSSSSGRYHPADEVNQGGLVLHSYRACLMGAKLIDFYNQDSSRNVIGNQNIEGDRRDLIVGALLLHDIEKGGIPWQRYDSAHGPLGASFLETVWKDNPHQAFAREMEQLVSNHMAQWNRAPGTRARDPKPPQDIPNQIVSYADYLGAQPDVFVQAFPGKDR